jgi:SAM-dependent methyltransferase
MAQPFARNSSLVLTRFRAIFGLDLKTTDDLAGNEVNSQAGANRRALALIMIYTSVIYLGIYLTHIGRPGRAIGSSWYQSWSDQHAYYDMATSIPKGSLGSFLFPPGYPFLGYLGSFLSPWDPFFITNYILFLLFITLSWRVFTEFLNKISSVIAALILVHTSVQMFVEPWTTSVTAAALALLSFIYVQKLYSIRWGVAAGLATALTFSARIGDVLILTPLLLLYFFDLARKPKALARFAVSAFVPACAIAGLTLFVNYRLSHSLLGPYVQRIRYTDGFNPAVIPGNLYGYFLDSWTYHGSMHTELTVWRVVPLLLLVPIGLGMLLANRATRRVGMMLALTIVAWLCEYAAYNGLNGVSLQHGSLHYCKALFPVLLASAFYAVQKISLSSGAPATTAGSLQKHEPGAGVKAQQRSAEHRLEELETSWEGLAEFDPFWAILSVPEKKGRRWNKDDFFREGEIEIERLISKLRTIGGAQASGAALDFGCGAGRLSQPLAKYYDRVTGVDISTGMLALARRFNQYPSRVQYIHNNVDNLAIFADGSVDLVYSNLVLQHMQPEYAINYIREFFRITKRGGFVVFQIPSHYTEEYQASQQAEPPLPEAACRAQIRALNVPAAMAAGSVATIDVEVQNISSEDWTQRKVTELNLGNHWLSENQKHTLIHDDGRSRLPGRLGSGERHTVSLEIIAPAAPGIYYLELDVVQEKVRWFKDVGSKTELVSVTVAPQSENGDRKQSSPDAPDADRGTSVPSNEAVQRPSFTMDGVPKEVILSIIESFGARLLEAEEHVTEWYSYKYYVRR